MKQTVCLEDIASFSKGQQINGDDLIPDGAFDYLNGGIKPSGKWSDYNVCGNSVTISEGGSCGYVNFMPSPFWCGAHCYYLFDVKGKSRYLYYALKSQQNRIMKIRSGACMPNIKKSDLGRFSFIFDDDEIEQDKVVSVLERVENIISTRQQQIAELDELVKSRFIEMFGLPGNSNGYIIKPIADVSEELFAGGDKPSDNMPEATTEYPYPVYSNGEGPNGLLCFSREYRVDKKAITISARGAIGYSAIREPFFTPVVRLLTVVPKPEMNIVFLKHFIDASRLTGTGSSQGQLTLPEFKKLMVPVPPIALQEQFAAFVRQSDKSKFAVRQALDKTQQLFDSLMQEYFG